MGGYRVRYTAEQHKVRGVALISALVVSVLVLIAIGSLYFLLTRLFETAESTRTYSSAREAAAAGVNYAIASGIFDTIASLEQCPDNASPVNNPNCPNVQELGISLGCRLNLKFKLKGSNQVYSNTVDVCFLGYSTLPGYQATGVAHSKLIPGNKGLVFSIISEVRDPQGLNTARIEAVYAP